MAKRYLPDADEALRRWIAGDVPDEVPPRGRGRPRGPNYKPRRKGSFSALNEPLWSFAADPERAKTLGRQAGRASAEARKRRRDARDKKG